jgi:hypothetical protein
LPFAGANALLHTRAVSHALLHFMGLPERLEKGAMANPLVAGYQCHSLSSRRGSDEAIGGIVREVFRE